LKSITYQKLTKTFTSEESTQAPEITQKLPKDINIHSKKNGHCVQAVSPGSDNWYDFNWIVGEHD
jgi:hypothetical protein